MPAPVARRKLLGLGAVATAGAFLAAPAARAMMNEGAVAGQARVPPRPPPISARERAERCRKAALLLKASGCGSMLIEAGSTLFYLTGIDWWRSERLTAALLSADGELMVVTPAFEQPSIEEMLAVPAQVNVWQEDENPAQLIRTWLARNHIGHLPMAVEPTVRFFAIDALRALQPDLLVRNGASIVDALRMIKSPAELALMQHAANITQAAYRAIAPNIAKGMIAADIFTMMSKETLVLGGQNPSGGIQIGEGSALPHGSKKEEKVGAGSVILMDCACQVDGYYSDISRTMVFGEPDKRQRQVWQQVREGQEVAMAAARTGVAAGKVDDAVRLYYERLGWGPGYRTPGLPHRTGHGIGLDIHEPVNLVHGEMTPLAAGMCFSNEPGIYIPGSFGIRLEDCFFMTAEGARFFTVPPTDMDQPFG
ncbi:Xaa-Pro peptidase family protein [Croceicoccus sp. F390]|uniref:Xaa-Pro peptidase family protein n=1 Tax=Croceicoccus esteveae TaxID=3075597 RepID=A0ABU2ZHU3_9SPHN|nr:Xaa-Pro peptidase family protein [Croceicoccus sp. F390]MDT0575926.1 Xaa-Pro peptidase family protein [Croceicoccus sp. F390]